MHKRRERCVTESMKCSGVRGVQVVLLIGRMRVVVESSECERRVFGAVMARVHVGWMKIRELS